MHVSITAYSKNNKQFYFINQTLGVLIKKVLKFLAIATLILIILTGITIYTFFNNFKKLETVEIIENFTKDTIPFVYTDLGHISINVKMQGGKKDFPFIIDSGAASMIFKNHSSEFNLKTKSIGLGRGTTGSYFISKIKKVDSIQIQSLVFKKFYVKEVDHGFECMENIYGIIGIGLMHHLNWQIDFQNKVIIVTRNIKDLQLGENKIEIDLTENEYSHHLYIPISLLSSPFTFNLTLDTGSPGSFIIDEHEILENNFKVNSKKINGTRAGGLGDSDYSPSNLKFYLIDSLFLQFDYQLKRVPVVAGPNNVNLLGLSFLKNYKTTINWPAQQLILEPYEIEQNFIRKVFGFDIIYDENLKKFLIYSITENTPATKNELPLNSEIISINGINSVDKTSLCEFKKIIMAKDTINISLKVDNVIKDYILIKEALFY